MQELLVSSLLVNHLLLLMVITIPLLLGIVTITNSQVILGDNVTINATAGINSAKCIVCCKRW